MSGSPTPSYHLCPDFSIAPPPHGHLNLGTILITPDGAGVSFPLNRSCLINVPNELIFPRMGPSGKAVSAALEVDGNNDAWDVKTGFTRSMGQLRKTEGSIWAKIAYGLGGKLGWLGERSEDETLTVEKVLSRYFIPSEAYLEKALGVPAVANFVTGRGKKKPLYMITGIKVAVGASLSKESSRTKGPGGEVGVIDPFTGAGVGVGVSYTKKDTANVGFTKSSDFVFGLRLRKIYWEKGVRKTTDNVVGATLDDNEGVETPRSRVMDDILVVDDFVVDNPSVEDDRVFMNEDVESGLEPSVWVLP